MSEMVERVARAVRETSLIGDRANYDFNFGSMFSDDLSKELGERIARAAIAAMREPTRKMTIAAEKMGAGEAWAEDAWSVMVDAALSDEAG